MDARAEQLKNLDHVADRGAEVLLRPDLVEDSGATLLKNADLAEGSGASCWKDDGSKCAGSHDCRDDAAHVAPARSNSQGQ